MAAILEQIPRLQNGDRLTRAEFERRYSAMPDLKKAELIEGEVHMPSPVSLLKHGKPHADILTWLGVYTAATPGILFGDNSTLCLDQDNEFQPDAMVLVPVEFGGQAEINEDGYVEGAPALAVEVAYSSVSIDLHRKKNVYRRSGVPEYIVWRVQDQAIDWFILKEGAYENLPMDTNSLYRSKILPGLVLEPAALIAGDLRKVLEIQNSAVKSEAHATFASRLAASKAAGPTN